MADVKISGMTAASALTGAEVLPVVQSAANVKATAQQVVDAAMTTGLTRQALGSINANTTIDWSAGSYVTATIAGALTFTFSNPAPTGKACVAYLQLTNGGSAAITWPVSVTWSGGTAPTLRASGVDLLRFYTQDNGTTWFGTAENDEANVAGSDTQVLFNDGGALSGDSGFTFNKTNNTVDLGGATVTASDPVIDASQTWNNAGVTFTGLKLNVTDTASNAASNLLVLQRNGNNVLRVGKDTLYIYGGDIAYMRSTIAYASTYFQADGATAGFVFNNGSGNYSGFWYGGAAGLVDMRAGAYAQSLRIYNTYTDASNYERLAINADAAGDWLQIAAETAGTGADNIGLAVTPAGAGAISAHVPDSGTAGGNARGSYATDWQKTRAAATQVASGIYAVIGGGASNTASGSQATVGGGTSNHATSNGATIAGGDTNVASNSNTAIGGGRSNTASGDTSTVSGGQYNEATGILSWISGGQYATTRSLWGAHAYASGRRSATGDAQVIGQPVRRTTTATSATDLTADGGAVSATNIMVLPNNSGAHFVARVMAYRSGGGVGSWRVEGTIERGANAASTALVGTTTITAFGISASIGAPTVDVVADTTQGGAKIQVTPANTDTTYWVGELILIQGA